MQLNSEHIEILDHTAHRTPRGMFYGDSPAMQELVVAGLMKSGGRVPWCGDEYFLMTGAGRAALRLSTTPTP